jgi:hypothetical protein
MLDDGSDYDAECQRIREENGTLLDEFSTWLADTGVSPTTIRSHRYNVDFFLNHFLLYYDTLEPCDGVGYIGEFLGDWFIRKSDMVKCAIDQSQCGQPEEVLCVYGGKRADQARGSICLESSDQRGHA